MQFKSIQWTWMQWKGLEGGKQKKIRSPKEDVLIIVRNRPKEVACLGSRHQRVAIHVTKDMGLQEKKTRGNGEQERPKKNNIYRGLPKKKALWLTLCPPILAISVLDVPMSQEAIDALLQPYLRRSLTWRRVRRRVTSFKFTFGLSKEGNLSDFSIYFQILISFYYIYLFMNYPFEPQFLICSSLRLVLIGVSFPSAPSLPPHGPLLPSTFSSPPGKPANLFGREPLPPWSTRRERRKAKKGREGEDG